MKELENRVHQDRDRCTHDDGYKERSRKHAEPNKERDGEKRFSLHRIDVSDVLLSKDELTGRPTEWVDTSFRDTEAATDIGFPPKIGRAHV